MTAGYRWQGPDLLLDLHVRPGARSSALSEPHGEALKVRIAAPAVDGRANDELIGLLAALFGVPKRQVVLERGRTGRRKRVRVVAPVRLPDGIVGR